MKTRWLGMVLALGTAAAVAADLPRHPLEDQALSDPDRVMRDVPALVARAKAAADWQQVATLELARANACRVVANWACQRDASAAASDAAREGKLPALEVRGLVGQARGYMALQDYTQGEQLLGKAELVLKQAPLPELSADIDLAYSSLSYALGKHQLAAKYAQRGLDRLGPDEALPMQVRLLRNHARSMSHLGQADAARAGLARATAISERFNDPKLSAELYLESARLARTEGDIAEQRLNGERVLALGTRLQNSQLAGLGHEVLGLAAHDADDHAGAQRELALAHAAFRELGQARDELRVARELITVMFDMGRPTGEIEPLVRRYLGLDDEIMQANRAQAADDFDARLKYAQQEFDVMRLQAEATLAQERERSLAATNRLTRFLVLLALVTLLVLTAFFILQRRSNRSLRKALMALRESEARATDLLRLSTGFVFLHDRDGRLLMVNPATAQALGLPPQALEGRSVRDFIDSPTEEGFDTYLSRVLEKGRDEGLLRIRMPGGEARHWRYGNRLSANEDGGAYIVGHAVDVTEQIQQTETLREQSERDPLTGAFNRRHIDDFALAHGDASWAAVNVDLDHFKSINDLHGHGHGDRVLIDFAQFLQQRVRAQDAVIRAGGDEFLVLLANSGDSALGALLERLQQDAIRAPCQFSLGWAVRQDGEPIEETLARADRAMYEKRARARAAV
jgi:diguanylate cyclase (GGDEF)-like protein/PAS domain S-box-containing protein